MNDVLLIRVLRSGNLLDTKATSKDTVLIGRDPASDIRIDNTAISRIHAQITHDASGYTVQDLYSRNGTLLNGAPIEGRQALADGDLIRIGNFELQIEIHEQQASSLTPDDHELDRQLAEETIPITKRK